MKKTGLILLLAIWLAPAALACTSIIVTGKHTPDGRPLMWKHRDTSQPANHIIYVKGERYAFIGLTDSNNSGDIWIGTNTAGFSLMNTASFNLKDDDVKEMDKEGRVMRRALEICKNTTDFEHFLDTLSRPMRIEANFGVIDAEGGAAYYETNNTRYYKRDANDAQLAPDGYLLCTNFSFNGRENEGYGFIRYASAKEIIRTWDVPAFTPEKLFLEGSNSFYNAQLGIRLYDSDKIPGIAPNGWAVEQDFISRRESTASVVIKGVKKGENPEMITMWTELGYPPLSIALPLWVKSGENLPALVRYDATCQTAPLCYFANTLRDRVYSISRGSGAKYLHWSRMWNKEGTGYMQQLAPVWKQVYHMFTAQEEKWRKHGLRPQEVEQTYAQSDSIIRAAYRSLIESDSLSKR